MCVGCTARVTFVGTQLIRRTAQILLGVSLLCATLGQIVRHVRDLCRADTFLYKRPSRSRSQDPGG
jgi:hypothetical protein